MAYKEARSGPLEKAFHVNSDAADWRVFGLQSNAPTTKYANQTFNPDGVFRVESDGVVTHNRAFMLPFCDGSPGSQFLMRLWGWRSLGEGVNQQIWIPFLLVELRCTAGTLNGLDFHQVRPNEHMSTKIEVVAGSLGDEGEVYSPDDGTAGFVVVNLRGSRRIQFDFKQGLVAPALANALWGRM